MMTLAVAFSYSPRPFYALGAEVGLFRVDMGADPQFCRGCTAGRIRGGPFGELRTPWDFPVNLFARGSLGIVAASRMGTGDELDWWAQITAGPDLRTGSVYLRPSVHTGTFGGRETWVGWGAEVGGVF